MSSTAHPFDRLAARYDEIWTSSDVGIFERQAVWEVLDTLFVRGERVLDMGCGTGVDCAHMARRGIRVHAADASTGMIAITRSRLQREAIQDGVTTEVRAMELLADATGFDGALLNFGVLNCVPDLALAARSLADAIRPGGRLVLCFMGRFYLWETMNFGLRMQMAKAMRRWRRGLVIASLEGSTLPVHYPSFREIESAFERYFSLVRRQGVGMFVPFLRVFPPAADLLARLDRAVASLPGIRAIGDHQLVVLVRQQTA